MLRQFLTDGKVFEKNFVEAFDGKVFGELNENLQNFANMLFSYNIGGKSTFHCCQTEDMIKPDVFILYKEDIKYISLKTGSSEGVHTEKLVTLIPFFKKYGISDESIETYLLFHYGDGSTDGSGENRLDGPTTRAALKERIAKMNKEFNANLDFVLAMVKRCVFEGVDPAAPKVDFIYHGFIDNGTFVKKSHLMRYVECRRWDFMDAPHIGPLVIRPHARYSRKPIKIEKNRHEACLTWPNFLYDLRYVASRYRRKIR